MRGFEVSPETDRPNAQLDARGLFCPMPILRASQAMQPLHAGEVLEVLATDPASPPDFVAFTKQTGHHLLSSTEEGGVYRFLIRHK